VIIRTSERLNIEDYADLAAIALEIAGSENLVHVEEWIGPAPLHSDWSLTFQAVQVPAFINGEPNPDPLPPAPTGNGMLVSPDEIIIQFSRSGEEVNILSVSRNVRLES